MTARFIALLLLAPGTVIGQQVELVVLEDASRTPVAGAIVRLLGETGPVAQGLTIESGRIVLRAPRAGTYRLRVDRIGWSGTLTGPFPLAAGQVLRREILMAAKRTELPALEVHGKSRCSREGQGGPLAAALWEEVSKALFANLITLRQSGLRLHVRGFLREVDLERRPVREWVHVAALMRGQPFATLTPSLLADVGFVQEESDSVLYAAPDATLLLSNEFVATHCFRAVAGEGGLVGLAFEPISERRVADVRGTLWVDRLTSELRHLEYGYTGLTRMLSGAGLGGRLDFSRLPSGGWIVSYWHIRTPRVAAMEVRRNGRLSPAYLSGFLDIGGRAGIAAAGLTLVDRAIVIGQVYDSLIGEGLRGAVVRIRGTPDSAVTDGEGRFVLSVPVSGDQLVVVSHPRERLLTRGGSRTYLLSLGDTTRAEFAVAPMTSYVRALCGSPGKNRSGVIGIAWGPDGEPAAGLEVVSQWDVDGGVKREIRDVGRGGTFAFCDLPPDRTLPFYLMEQRRPRANASVRLEFGEFRWVELRAAVP